MFKEFRVKSLFLMSVAVLFGAFSCAPVKFTREDSIVVNPNDTNKAISCDPKINNTLVEFVYNDGVALPRIQSRCNPTDIEIEYTWTVTKTDGAVITTAIPGLSGINPTNANPTNANPTNVNPTNVNFKVLGEGTYFVYLKAVNPTGTHSAYNATVPLKFIVPGVTVVPVNMACNPKLNASSTSVVVGPSDNNPMVTANCNPAASTYTWTVKKGTSETPIAVSGLNGASSTPNFKTLGVGDYRIYLYAIHSTGSTWESTGPLNVKVIDDSPGDSGTIKCNPRIEGSLTNLTITPASPNPLISANCSPSAIQYNWIVTKNGSTVAVPGLSGANSNPSFGSLGEGTYLIHLTGAKPGMTSWSSTQPLMITVQGPGNPNLTLNCKPRLNDTFVAISITTAGPNPKVTSGCDQQSVNHTWTVTKDGNPITITGLNGPLSTPNIIARGTGTYLIYLTATKSGYNTYVSTSPLEVTVGKTGPNTRQVTYTKQVMTTDNKVDILLVVDDSNSMLPENRKLASRLRNFVNDLSASGLDWQMCTTVTRATNVSGTMYWGASKMWIGYLGSPQWLLKKGATDPYAIFVDTIETIGAGWADTDDERAIKAAYWHAEYSSSNNCYRSDAALAVIILSDEDERSIGGNMDLQYYYNEYKPLEADDLPQTYVNKIKQKFGDKKPLTVNSIIVKPGDSACLASQDAGGAKSHYGYKYKELSDLTQGYVGSICDSDYSNSLYYFKDKIKSSLSSIPLECAPVGDIKVTITPTMGSVTSKTVGNTLVFTPEIPAGRTVKIDYDCPIN